MKFISDPMTAQPKVRQHLSFVDRQQLFDGFNLDNELTLGDNIHSKTTFEPDLLVDQRERHLATISHARLLEYETQAFFID